MPKLYQHTTGNNGPAYLLFTVCMRNLKKMQSHVIMLTCTFFFIACCEQLLINHVSHLASVALLGGGLTIPGTLTMNENKGAFHDCNSEIHENRLIFNCFLITV